MPLYQKIVIIAFKFVNGFDNMPVQKETITNIPPFKERAIMTLKFINSIDNILIQMKKIYTIERYNNLHKDMTIY